MPRAKSSEEIIEESGRDFRRDYFCKKAKAHRNPRPPFRVDLVDQFHGSDEYGYAHVDDFESLGAAIAEAKKITEEGIKHCGSYSDWAGMGDAGLVYDADRQLIWSGVSEAEDEYNSQRISSAIEIAARAHKGQFRKGTNIPYIFHPLGVGKILAEHGCSGAVIVSGILHDTLEDTDTSLKEISKQFGEEVSSIVKWCTTLDDESEPWKDRKKRTLESIKAAPFRAVLVAGADKLDNIRAIRRDYVQIGDDLWGRFNAPKEDLEWYYSELVPIFDVYLDDCAFDNIFREYIELVSLVFR